MSQRIVFTVPDLARDADADLIEGELLGLGGVIDAAADVAQQSVAVTWDPPASWPAVQTVLAEIGFPIGVLLEQD